MSIYAGLEKNDLYTQDKKIPFQWIQAGNTGNTDGGSSKPHGTASWTPGANGTLVAVDPKPNWDDFIFYSVLPYPDAPPKLLSAVVGNWSASSVIGWSKSQQMEGPQLEYIGGGFKYTFCWSVEPQKGLRYWAGAEKWKSFPAGVSIKSLSAPTFWFAEFSLDPVRHICRYENLVINYQLFEMGVEVPAVPAPRQQREFSVAVQLDGNKAGDAYSALLNNLVVEVK